ncbi:response regulator [Antarcticibacterium arcticum]|uniref:Response regulator n=1 Tax=Antarcticibacterium arcticum TaxID=2585771 RepID=A0A5B8YK78_9FLAO|nr:response regulator [Antarcticibacterium arcticum]QED37013.1 response regulator [Antarcticibacterium arcticum]
MKILIVDDNKINVMIVRRYLEKWGYNFQIAGNGKEALEMIQAEKFDIILMDLNMPVMDGLEATYEIRKLPGCEFKQLPIIGFTSSTEKILEEKMYDAGFTDILQKPFLPEDLHEKIGSKKG